ncbi:Uncharacterised protein [Mycobacteroides abscessus subsp. abscessus]|nr:Uncharacterised protein [Mycobacteroides abscessus subsp. abscessus]
MRDWQRPHRHNPDNRYLRGDRLRFHERTDNAANT